MIGIGGAVAAAAAGGMDLPVTSRRSFSLSVTLPSQDPVMRPLADRQAA
jgi:hypothetical protein